MGSSRLVYRDSAGVFPRGRRELARLVDRTVASLERRDAAMQSFVAVHFLVAFDLPLLVKAMCWLNRLLAACVGKATAGPPHLAVVLQPGSPEMVIVATRRPLMLVSYLAQVAENQRGYLLVSVVASLV